MEAGKTKDWWNWVFAALGLLLFFQPLIGIPVALAIAVGASRRGQRQPAIACVVLAALGLLWIGLIVYGAPVPIGHGR